MTNEKVQEEISALMDGELDHFATKRVLDRTLQDPDAVRRWKSYHLISDTLQHGLHGPDGDELRDRVRKALQEQPAIHGGPRQWLKPAAGFALAASVAVVAVLGVRSLEQGGSGPPGGVQEIASVSGQSGGQATQQQVMASANAGARDDKRLKRYLVDHAELASSHINGALAYARVVSYDGSR